MSAPVGVCKIEASLSPSERENARIELKSLEKLKLSHSDMKCKCKFSFKLVGMLLNHIDMK